MEHAAKGFILNYNGNNLDEAGSLLKKRTGGAFELFDKNSRQMTTNKDVPIMRPEHISDFRQLVESAGPSGHFEINANVNNLGSSSDSSVTQRIIYGIILPTGEMLVITKAMGFVQEASNMFFCIYDKGFCSGLCGRFYFDILYFEATHQTSYKNEKYHKKNGSLRFF